MSDADSVLKARGKAPISGIQGPFVWISLNDISSRFAINDLNSSYKVGLYEVFLALLVTDKVWNIRIFMEMFPYPMPSEVAQHLIPSTMDALLHGLTYNR